MNVVQLGPLRARRVEISSGRQDKAPSEEPLTIVLLHGFGAPGDDLVGLAGAIGAPPGTRFVFPEAPVALAELEGAPPILGDARAWWLIDLARLERALLRGEVRDLSRDIPEGLASARQALTGMLDALAEEEPGSRLVLGGFSQGAMLATDLALRSARPLAGLVVLSGTMIAEEEWLPRMPSRAGLPVLQSHGTSDPLLPYSIAERLRDALAGAGARVTFLRFDGGHGVPPEVLAALGRWLGELG